MLYMLVKHRCVVTEYNRFQRPEVSKQTELWGHSQFGQSSAANIQSCPDAWQSHCTCCPHGTAAIFIVVQQRKAELSFTAEGYQS